MNKSVWEHHSPILSPLMKSWWEKKQIAPVLLLAGPEGIGKREAAHELARWILCEETGFKQTASEDEGPGLFGGGFNLGGSSADAAPKAFRASACGACKSCRLASSKQWIDFQEIRVAEDETSLKIDIFRDLKSSLGFGAYEGAYRIILIDEAERLTPQAANSLLKILEEPPKGWIFFLTAKDPSLLLPTLVSRCQTLRLRPLSDDALRNALREAEAPVERIETLIKLSHGSFKRALSLSDPEVFEQRTRIFRFLANPASEIQGLTDWTALEPGHFEFLLTTLESVASDLYLHKSTGNPFLNTDGAEVLKRITGRFSTQVLSGLCDRHFEIRTQLGIPLNRKILTQELLMRWGTPEQ